MEFYSYFIKWKLSKLAYIPGSNALDAMLASGPAR